MISRSLVVALSAIALSACSSCARRDPASPADAATGAPSRTPGFTLVFSAALVGYLEPCGCSPDQRGGVARAAAAVAAIRGEGRPVLLVDGGDRFFASASPATDPLVRQQHLLQAHTMAEVTRAMRYDALVLGARDAGAGATFFADLPLPDVLDTGDAPRPGTTASLVRDVGGTKVGVFAVGSGEDAPRTLAARASALREQGAQVLVLVAYRTVHEAAELRAAAKDAGVDIILASRTEVPELHESAALTDSEPPVLTVHARGEALLRLDIVAGGAPEAPFRKVEGAQEREASLAAMQQRIENLREDVRKLAPGDEMRKLKTDKLLELEERTAKLAAAPPPPLPANANAFTYAFVPMTPHLEQQPQVRALVEGYHEKVAAENVAWAKEHPKACPEAKKDEPAYIGTAGCVECHEEAVAFWEKTGHAHAYETLVDKKRQFDTACITCHVTGWEKPGGACSIVQVEKRMDVQCESCHGPGSLHADTEGKVELVADTPEKTCAGCHDADNSPHFNFKLYRPKIIGPGHGEALPGRPN